MAQLGYPDKPADSAFGFDYDTNFRDSVEKESKPNWDEVLAGRPTVLQFWYRQSPDEMGADSFHDSFLTPGIVTEDDPATTLSGMINLKLDAAGRLTYLQVIPPQKDTSAPSAAPPDWSSVIFRGGIGSIEATAGATGVDFAGHGRRTRRMDGSLARLDSSAAGGGSRMAWQAGIFCGDRRLEQAVADGCGPIRRREEKSGEPDDQCVSADRCPGRGCAAGPPQLSPRPRRPRWRVATGSGHVHSGNWNLAMPLALCHGDCDIRLYDSGNCRSAAVEWRDVDALPGDRTMDST